MNLLNNILFDLINLKINKITIKNLMLIKYLHSIFVYFLNTRKLISGDIPV